MTDRLRTVRERIIRTGAGIGRSEAQAFVEGPPEELDALASTADRVREHFRGRRLELEAITNIKSGTCPEDCSFCSQSAHFDTDAEKYPLVDADEILRRARSAEETGASQFCLVAAWRGPSEQDFRRVLKLVRRLQDKTRLDIHCSLGFICEW